MSVDVKADILYNVAAAVWSRAELLYRSRLYQIADELVKYFDELVRMEIFDNT